MQKKISIITICYNEPNVRLTCESVVNQTWQDFEWIVIDGASNKKTLDILEKYKHRMDYYCSENDSGVYNAMNKALRIAEGEYILFLNAGDYLCNKSTLKEILAHSFDKDIISCNELHIQKDETIQRCYAPEFVDKKFLITNTLRHQATFIKKNLFDKYGLYSEGLKVASDYEKWIVFLLVNSCSYKRIDVDCDVFDPNGLSSNKNKKNQIIHEKERKQILATYFTQKEIDTAVLGNVKYSLKEKLFSIAIYLV